MPRYVILRHELPADSDRRSHWDLMLESDGALRTWAIEELPAPGRSIAALELSPHRLVYLEYEGPVSNNRGSVTRYDRGEYELLADTADLCRVILTGERLQGTLSLTRDRVVPERWIVLMSAKKMPPEATSPRGA